MNRWCVQKLQTFENFRKAYGVSSKVNFKHLSNDNTSYQVCVLKRNTKLLIVRTFTHRTNTWCMWIGISHYVYQQKQIKVKSPWNIYVLGKKISCEYNKLTYKVKQTTTLRAEDTKPIVFVSAENCLFINPNNTQIWPYVMISDHQQFAFENRERCHQNCTGDFHRSNCSVLATFRLLIVRKISI